MGTVGTGEAARAGVAVVDGAGRSRGTRGGPSTPGGWSRGLAGPKAMVDSMGCNTCCCCCTTEVRVEMRSEDGFTVWGTGKPGEAGADAVRPVVPTESVS